MQWWILATLLLNVWVAAVALFRDPYPYSINRIFWVFVLLFFGLVPGFQIVTNRIPWGNDIALPTFLTANLLILAGCGVYQLTRYTLAATIEARPIPFRSRIDAGWLKSWQTVGLGLFLVLSLAYFLITGADAVLLQKDILNKWRDRVPDALFLLVEKAIRAPVLYYSLLSVFLYRLRRISKPVLTGVLVVGLLVNFPLAMPRTLAATVVLSLLLAFGGAYWQRRRQAFTGLLLIGLLGIFPILQLARRTSDRMSMPKNVVDLYAYSFQLGDFDAYAMLCRTIDYTRSHGFRKGQQLQTTLAFAVPRSVWPQKGIGSGAHLRRAAGKTFTNVSCPLLAEGFIDFGWAGALLYFALLAALARQYDQYYWYWRQYRAAEGDVSFRALFYPVVMMLLFQVLRGDLLSSLAQLAGMWAFAWGMHQVIRISGSAFRRWGAGKP